MFKKLIFLMFFCLSTVAIAADSKVNIVILLDTSGSMMEQMRTVRQTKWNAAINALTGVVSKIDPNTNVGLLTFDPTWPYELSSIDKDKLTQSILKTEITPMSGTPLGTYLKVAADKLLEEREKSFGYGVYKIIVVTDGDPTYETEGLVDLYVPEILSRGIIVECIGVSMSNASILKNKVNRYMSADDPESLNEQINDTVLAEISNQDDLQGDMFLETQSLPTPLVTTIIDTLGNSGNHPIGEEPKEILTQEQIDQQGNVQDPSGSAISLKWVFIALGCLIFFGLLSSING